MSLSPAAKTLGDQPAFPVPPNIANNVHDDIHWEYASPGLTKREFFAGLVMQGLCANANYTSSEQGYAKDALLQADALLEVLVKQEEIK